MRRIVIAALAIMLLSAALIGSGIGLAVAQGEDAPVQTFLGRVAEKLGIGEDELRSAMAEAQQDIIDERVAEGRLTAEQGEHLRERLEDRGLLGPRDRFGIRDRVGDRHGRLTVEAAATVLGLEPETLLSELQEGKTMAEVAEAQGISVEDFEAALLAQVKAQLADLVPDQLTQEQADAIHDRVGENIDDIVNALPRPHGPCPRGAFFEGGAPGPSFEPTESSIEA
jgi:uncharacterized protein YidB (DUF937 family)